MDTMSELVKALEDSNRQFEKFKERIEARIIDGETKEAKRNRPRMGGSYGIDPDQKAASEALNRYVKSGDDAELKSLSTGSGPDGGYAVPKVIDGMIEDVAINISPIRQVSQVVQISTPDYHRLVTTGGTGSGWVDESEARPETDSPALSNISPPMGEIYANIGATQVMLDDALFNADQWIAENAGVEFARAEGAAFINGTGVKQPLGFLMSPSAATADGSRDFGTLEYVATGASGAFKTLSATVNPVDDLFTLVSKLKAQYRRDACWIMNKKTLFAIMGFKDYQGRFVFSPATAPGMQDTLMGYPIYEAEDMPDYTTSNAMAIAFGNFKRGYLIADRVGTRVLRDPFSAKPKVMFYITKRLGGCVLNSECIKLLKFGTA